MKTRNIITIFFLVASLATTSASNDINVSAKIIGGYIVPFHKNTSLIATKPAFGGEISIEFPNLSQYNWHRYWNRPTAGVSLVYYYLGNPDLLGSAIAIYPYVLVPFVDNKALRFNFKLGVGLSFFNKTWAQGDTLSGIYAPTANAAIGSHVNGYITAGLDLEIKLSKTTSLTTDITFAHMSNGSIQRPNGGLNIITPSLGITYKYGNSRRPYYANNRGAYIRLKGIPYEWSLNVVASGGARHLYYSDSKKYPIASLHAGATYQVCNIYAIGGGLDFFYDGAYVRQGITSDMTAEEKAEQQQHTLFFKHLILEDNIKNKFRVGACVSNEFLMGRFTALLDLGLYLYDPINRTGKFMYAYDVNKEDGWSYIRLGLRYRVCDNIFVHTSMKSHMQKVEFLEFGIGYQIPFTRRGRNIHKHSWQVFRHGEKYKRPNRMFY